MKRRATRTVTRGPTTVTTPYEVEFTAAELRRRLRLPDGAVLFVGGFPRIDEPVGILSLVATYTRTTTRSRKSREGAAETAANGDAVVSAIIPTGQACPPPPSEIPSEPSPGAALVGTTTGRKEPAPKTLRVEWPPATPEHD